MNQSQGESLFMQGKIDEAVVELQKEAKMGAPRAMYLIGCCLREGYGHVEADERKAVKWFQKGYEEGSALCGISLVNGTDDQEMWDIVNECFPRVLKAAVSGDVLAMDEAGRFYLGAFIVNFEEGMKWLTKAALAEYWRALYDLGSAYEEGYAVPRDEERAMLCFKKAAEFHDQYSEYKVGEMLLNFWKKEKDTKKAAEWLKKSWKHGNGEAAMLLASVYENSDDKEDQEKAFRWYERAAEAGIPEALAELAYDYDQGFVVEKDRKKGSSRFFVG